MALLEIKENLLDMKRNADQSFLDIDSIISAWGDKRNQIFNLINKIEDVMDDLDDIMETIDDIESEVYVPESIHLNY